MNVFQWLSLGALLILLVFELLSATRQRVRRGFWTLRVLIWIAAGLAIARPEMLTHVARILGIQRGADLMLYLAVLAVCATSLLLYGRCVKLQQQITELVRHLAIRDAAGPPREE